MERHFGSSKTMSIRQTRRGCFQELLGCEALDEFKWFNTTDGQNQQFATSLEESNCCMRLFCSGCHEFTMKVTEEGSGAEVLAMHRPMACNAGACKCCCYQTMTMTTGGRALGKIEELCWVCIPRMMITDSNGANLYKVHPPTCCGGMCVDICSEGNPCCGKGCCKIAFHIFPADQKDTDNGAPHAGKIVKVPKSIMSEMFTDAEAFDVSFPEGSTSEQKALIAASSVFINANFFESENE
jgi:hypothetical protein